MGNLKQLLKARNITQVKLARGVGVTQPTVSEWLKRGSPPAERVLAIESATGIPRHELRPDLYPTEGG